MFFEPVIGLEIHAQLLTETKMFCGCRTRFGAAPNTETCPVCLGLPGALPLVNRRAVEFAVKAALSLHCRIHPESIFARKNYFYPDLPKGYQISQYERPLATKGWVEVPSAGRVGITRLHLEEDAGKSLHHGFADSDRSTYLDFNRSGVPLIEIVTEPDLRSAPEAAACFSRLRELLVALGVNDGNMEEGSLRCDANVSVRAPGAVAFGTKTEVKNVNSFRYLQRALEFEVARQSSVLAGGGRIRQETRLWDSAAGETVPMRSKENADDYRYFPEPDLPPLRLDAAWIDDLRATLPELPEARRARFVTQHGLSDYDTDVILRLPGGAEYVDATVRAGASAKSASRWLQGEIRRLLKDAGTDDARDARVRPAALAELIALTDAGTISGTQAKDVLETMWASGRAAGEIVAAEGLAQTADRDALAAVVADVLRRHAPVVAQYRAGKASAFGFLVGQAMKATQGRGNPQLLNELLKAALSRL